MQFVYHYNFRMTFALPCRMPKVGKTVDRLYRSFYFVLTYMSSSLSSHVIDLYNFRMYFEEDFSPATRPSLPLSDTFSSGESDDLGNDHN